MQKKSILFVCLGNICRSPMAEAVMQKIVDEHRLSDFFNIDSAGIIAYHQGEAPDRRMQQQAFARGYRLHHRSRPITYSDFEAFDLIIGMDDGNIDSLEGHALRLEDKQKIYRMADFLSDKDSDCIPDPYYGDAFGFDMVIDLLEDGCSNLFELLLEGRINRD